MIPAYLPSNNSKQNHKTIATIFKDTATQLTALQASVASSTPKAAVAFNGVTGVAASQFGLRAFSKNATGTYLATFAKPFKTKAFHVSGNSLMAVAPTGPASYTIKTVDSSGALADLDYVSVFFWGDV